MRDDDIPQDVLERLPPILRSAHLPVQSVIAKAIDVDQPFVSRVLNGEVKRVTERVGRLWRYASSRMAEAERAADAVADIERESSSPADKGVTDRPARLRPRRRPADIAIESDVFTDDALSGVKAYLADGYDPRLIVEQLVVLRRAQHVRRPGRSTGRSS